MAICHVEQVVIAQKEGQREVKPKTLGIVDECTQTAHTHADVCPMPPPLMRLLACVARPSVVQTLQCFVQCYFICLLHLFVDRKWSIPARVQYQMSHYNDQLSHYTPRPWSSLRPFVFRCTVHARDNLQGPLPSAAPCGPTLRTVLLKQHELREDHAVMFDEQPPSREHSSGLATTPAPFLKWQGVCTSGQCSEAPVFAKFSHRYLQRPD